MRRPKPALLSYLGLGGLLLILLAASYWLGQRLEEREGQRAEERLAYQASSLARQLESDAACRYGGEEFAIILAGTGLDGASHIAERVHEQIAELRISHPECNLGYLTLSIGLAIATPGDDDDPELLIAQADRALYAAKNRGGNTTCVWPLSH
ncbi:GGDEF domain-containing protein [Pseudomonas schmalbachii]|uniref:diguanylate cyclase n=1 Tax=Pseudomonas schmalbachii TaxID=2816993 RepID=A0ABS3TVZ5_9PSED|nr:GGDEF domain-containing protein [Pseudomonas schmalbachii]MBO3277849.1 GGDEF domain-containing protein [Pseudomonas schmalbachii]